MRDSCLRAVTVLDLRRMLALLLSDENSGATPE